jgi:hypothetical protein
MNNRNRLAFNAVTRRPQSNKVVNEENYQTYKFREDQHLFLLASSFTPRNSFYHSDVERLKMFENSIDKNLKSDPTYVAALAWWLGTKLGIRLGPTIMTTRFAMSNLVNWKYVKKIVKDVFTRPDFIANSLGYAKYTKKSNSFLEAIPKEFKINLKNCLEHMSEMTLKRQKMKRRKIKLSHLIISLRPRPKTKEISKLYKAIIENDPFASLKVEVKEGEIQSAEHITAAITSNKISYEQKKKYVQQEISKIPVNALIKNLSFLEAKDAPILKKRLIDLFESGQGMRFINPYDLILMDSLEFDKYTSGVRTSEDIINVLDFVLKKYVNVSIDAKRPLILYDYSGSMQGQAHRTGTKFISLLTSIFEQKFNFYIFDDKIRNITNDIDEMYSDSSGVNDFARKFNKFVVPYNGTSLLECMKDALGRHPQTDLFIIVTDEITWADPRYIESYKHVLPQHLLGKTVLFNAAPGIGTIFKPSADITRLAGLSGMVLTMIRSIADFDLFKKQILDDFNR